MSFSDMVQKVLYYPLIKFGTTEVTLLTIVDFLIVIAIAFIVAFFAQWFLKKRIFKFAKFDSGVQYMISRIGGYFIFLLGFFIGLQTLGIDLTSFTVLAGAVGVGIGFGLQNIVNNFISGLILLSERQIQVGDRIEVAGVNGFIQNIGARSSTLLTPDNLLIIVPNSELISKMVTRWWGRYEQYPCRLEVQVGVAFNTDLKLVSTLLLDIAVKNPHVLKQPPPFAGIVEFGDHWIVFKLYFSTFDRINQEMALKTEIYMAIQEAFEENGIIIPSPHYNVAIKPLISEAKP